jgi:hypothetical protein
MYVHNLGIKQEWLEINFVADKNAELDIQGPSCSTQPSIAMWEVLSKCRYLSTISLHSILKWGQYDCTIICK